jgi:hypothetical protein
MPVALPPGPIEAGDEPFLDGVTGHAEQAQSLHGYFNLLQDRLSRAGAVKRFELAFFLRGPMEQRSKISGLQFWREAPKIGLTGVSEIEIGQQGIIAERVAYDLNLVSDMLFRSPMTSRLVN